MIAAISDMRSAFDSGAKAALRGEQRDACPHGTKDPVRRAAWFKGWFLVAEHVLPGAPE